MSVKKAAVAIASALTLGGPTVFNAHAAPAEPFGEYAVQYGLGSLGVLYPWGAGATGAGVTVAVIDSGANLNHQDIRPNLAPGGIDFINNDQVPADDSENGHGTSVASIIGAARNGVDTVGVAYDSKLLIIKVTRADQSQNFEATVRGLDYATASDARVINMSLVNRPEDSVFLALQRAAAAGKVITMPAGNEGGPGPRTYAAYAPFLDGNALIVGATNPDGTLASFSNQAGPLADDYVVAPGVQIVTARVSGETGLTTQNPGTSFAAPHAAGVAALLFSAFPNLSSQQVVQIIKETATDLGEPGVDTVYGWGQVNAQAALAPQGELQIPGGGGDSGSSSGGAVAAAALVVGGAVGYAVLRNGGEDELGQALILDKYDRPYVADVTPLVSVRDGLPGLSSLMDGLRAQTGAVGLGLGRNSHLDIAYAVDGTPELDPVFELNRGFEHEQDYLDKSMSFSFGGSMRGQLDYEFNLNANPARDFGVLAGDGPLRGVSFITERAFTSPVLGFADSADSINLGYALSDRADLRFGMVEVDDDQRFGQQSTTTLLEGEWEVNNRATLGLQLAQLVEDGSLLGGASGGPLSVDSATTLSLGVSASYRLNDSITLVGNVAQGHTEVEDSDSAVIGDFTSIRSNAFGLGMLVDGLLRKADRAGFAVSRPLRVSNGSAVLDVATGVDDEFNFVRSRERVGLTPDARETDLEAWYKVNLSSHSDLGAYLVYQHNPYHTTLVDDRVTLYTTYQVKF